LVLPSASSLFLLWTIVVVFYDTMPEGSVYLRQKSCFAKPRFSYNDMIISGGHHLWMQWIFEHTPGDTAVRKLPAPTRTLVDFGVTQAA
jgi:hypothetical protein